MFALTPRLTLRPGWPEDAAALARAIGHESVLRNLARAPWPYALGDAEAYLALPCRPDEPRCLVFDRTGPEPRLIGGIAIDRHDDGTAELGYWLTPDAWGRGYATEAGRAVVAIARDGLRLPRLQSSYRVGNTASARVLGKLGFCPTGRTLRLPSRALGGEMDAVEMALDLDGSQTGEVPLAA
jgi:RimJ/RimL family protein N-acetyltransferase